MGDATQFEAPDVAAAFLLWQRELHPFTCGGGGGPCAGVELELRAANPHAFLMECPKCGRQQLEHQDGRYFDHVMDYAAKHDPLECWTCRFIAQSKIGTPLAMLPHASENESDRKGEG